jgi:hypothetical protein
LIYSPIPLPLPDLFCRPSPLFLLLDMLSPSSLPSPCSVLPFLSPSSSLICSLPTPLHYFFPQKKTRKPEKKVKKLDEYFTKKNSGEPTIETVPGSVIQAAEEDKKWVRSLNLIFEDFLFGPEIFWGKEFKILFWIFWI